MKVQDVALDAIEQNENSRVIYKQGDLVDLITSMREHGLLQPVGVRKIAGGKFDAVYGNRRIQAAKRLGWQTIPAHVMEGVETDESREILNLVENLKRQNTTLPEDGRIFQKLREEHKLTIPEIAARVGVTPTRVELAIEAFMDIPKEYHSKMTNVGQKKNTPGSISAHTSYEILKLKRQHNLNRDQTKTLLEAARTQALNGEQIRNAAPLVKEGVDMTKVVHLMKDVRMVQLRVYVSEKQVKKLEKKMKKSLQEMLYDRLEAFPKVQIRRRVGPGSLFTPKNRPSLEPAAHEEAAE